VWNSRLASLAGQHIVGKGSSCSSNASTQPWRIVHSSEQIEERGGSEEGSPLERERE